LYVRVQDQFCAVSWRGLRRRRGVTIPEESLRVVHSTERGMAHLHGSLRRRVTCSHHLGMKFMQRYVDRKRLCRDEPPSTPSGLAAVQPIILHMRQYTIRPLRIGAADDFGSGGVWQHSRGFWGDREWWWGGGCTPELTGDGSARSACVWSVAEQPAPGGSVCW
jgi:hypothetical protein